MSQKARPWLTDPNLGRQTTFHGFVQHSFKQEEHTLWDDMPQIIFLPTLPFILFFETTAVGLSLILHYAAPSAEIGVLAQVIYGVLSIPLGYFLVNYIGIALQRYQNGGRTFLTILYKLLSMTGNLVTSVESHNTMGADAAQILENLEQILIALPYAVREKFAHPQQGETTLSRLDVVQNRSIFDQHGVDITGRPTATPGLDGEMTVSEMPVILLHKMRREIVRFTSLPEMKDFQGSYFLFSGLSQIEDDIANITANETIVVPPVYVNFLMVIVFLYLLLLPLFIPATMHWWIALLVEPLATYILMGMFILGSSMREPFENKHHNPFSHENTQGMANNFAMRIRQHFARLMTRLTKTTPIKETVAAASVHSHLRFRKEDL